MWCRTDFPADIQQVASGAIAIVAAGEDMEQGKRSIRRQPEHTAIGAGALGGAVKVARLVASETASGKCAVVLVRKGIEHTFRAIRRNLVNCARAVESADLCRAVQIAGAVSDRAVRRASAASPAPKACSTVKLPSAAILNRVP